MRYVKGLLMGRPTGIDGLYGILKLHGGHIPGGG